MTEFDDAVISVRNLTKTFGGVTAVDSATFDVPDGEIVGIIGPNGAGKTTLFRTIAGLHKPDSGEIRLRNESIENLPTPGRAKKGIGMTFQIPQVFEGMTVEDNIRVAAKGQSGESIRNLFLRQSTVDSEETRIRYRAAEVIEFLELDHLTGEYAKGLSGGQSKLLELGRVLMGQPEVILLDEPVAGVNPALSDRLLERLDALNDDGITLLVIEHDMSVVMDFCDRVVVIDNGEVISVGTPEEIQQDERVLEAYLGDAS
jgi:branched-chain amino acid transport system ATP-binding protein